MTPTKFRGVISRNYCYISYFHRTQVSRASQRQQGVMEAGRNSSQKLKISGFPCDEEYEGKERTGKGG